MTSSTTVPVTFSRQHEYARILFAESARHFRPDRHEAARWYAALTGQPILTLEDPEHFFIRVGPQEIGFLTADSKTPAGTAGQVAYWRVPDFDAMTAHAARLGASLYRGPLDRGDGLWMCQMRDPFGNLFGFIGAGA